MFCSTQNEFVEAVTTIAPPSRCGHHPAGLLHAQEDARQVDVEHALPAAVVDLEQRLDVGDAGVGDHRVEAPELLERRCVTAAAHVLAPADVAGHRVHGPGRSSARPRSRRPGRRRGRAITTLAPSARKRSATARPIPCAPPVTTTAAGGRARSSVVEHLPAVDRDDDSGDPRGSPARSGSRPTARARRPWRCARAGPDPRASGRPPRGRPPRWRGSGVSTGPGCDAVDPDPMPRPARPRATWSGTRARPCSCRRPTGRAAPSSPTTS